MSELFLGEHIPDEITRFATHVGPEPDEVLAEMERVARDEGFPIVGPAVGGWLCQLARLVDATRVFEFGSGYGYSACWFARALPADGEIVLTELDEQNLERARSYLDRLGVADLATIEVGDAVEIARKHDGTFDLALLDIEKYQYVAAFETIRDHIPPGGAVLADNTMSAGREAPDDTVDFEVLLRAIETDDYDVESGDLDDLGTQSTRGILEYIAHVSDHPDFETTVLPLGDGLTVSTRIR